MKHFSPISLVNDRPARAESLLVKEHEIAVVGDAIAVLGDAFDFVTAVADRIKGQDA